ncbi:MAG: hypothetical protein HS122_04775 [Opitutaceae bacterium]|nr:hypothetical protein [Opitutaceae bacterium]
MTKTAVLLLFLALGLASGCSTNGSNAAFAPQFDRTKVKFVFVERRLADNNNVRDRFVDALRARGFTAEAGPLTLMPEKGVDVVLVYEDYWEWNFGNHMVELRVQLRNPRTNELLAGSVLRRGAVFGKNTSEMVQAIVDDLFKNSSRKHQLL